MNFRIRMFVKSAVTVSQIGPDNLYFFTVTFVKRRFHNNRFCIVALFEFWPQGFTCILAVSPTALFYITWFLSLFHFLLFLTSLLLLFTLL